MGKHTVELTTETERVRWENRVRPPASITVTKFYLGNDFFNYLQTQGVGHAHL